MKAAIHPAYNEIRVQCACGNAFTTRSTHKGAENTARLMARSDTNLFRVRTKQNGRADPLPFS